MTGSRVVDLVWDPQAIGGDWVKSSTSPRLHASLKGSPLRVEVGAPNDLALNRKFVDGLQALVVQFAVDADALRPVVVEAKR